jgi:hypothetical protein
MALALALALCIIVAVSLVPDLDWDCPVVA